MNSETLIINIIITTWMRVPQCANFVTNCMTTRRWYYLPGVGYQQWRIFAASIRNLGSVLETPLRTPHRGGGKNTQCFLMIWNFKYAIIWPTRTGIGATVWSDLLVLWDDWRELWLPYCRATTRNSEEKRPSKNSSGTSWMDWMIIFLLKVFFLLNFELWFGSSDAMSKK